MECRPHSRPFSVTTRLRQETRLAPDSHLSMVSAICDFGSNRLRDPREQVKFCSESLGQSIECNRAVAVCVRPSPSAATWQLTVVHFGAGAKNRLNRRAQLSHQGKGCSFEWYLE
jgi:hypothetical protein